MFYLGFGCGFFIGGVVVFLSTLRLFCSPVIDRCDELEVEVSRLRGEVDRSKQRIKGYGEEVEKIRRRGLGMA